MRGVIRTLKEKGFGFIRPDDVTMKDVFFHLSKVNGRKRFDELKVGDVVEFDVETTERGIQASDVVFTE